MARRLSESGVLFVQIYGGGGGNGGLGGLGGNPGGVVTHTATGGGAAGSHGGQATPSFRFNVQ